MGEVEPGNHVFSKIIVQLTAQLIDLTSLLN